MRGSIRHPGLTLLLALLASTLLAACTSGAVPRQGDEHPLKATLMGQPAEGIDQYRLKLPLVLRLKNAGGQVLEIRRITSFLSVEDSGREEIDSAAPIMLQPGEEREFRLEFAVDTRPSGSTKGPGLAAPGEAAGPAGDESPAAGSASGPAVGPAAAGRPDHARWEAETDITGISGAGEFAVAARTDGTVPIIREPLFRITSVTIERDLLVTTRLSLDVEVENPNAFPVSLTAFTYDFYGEDRAWVTGGRDEKVTIAPNSRLERKLDFTMNFADMERHLFDLVAELRRVRYRLVGGASVDTGLDYLPSFDTRFDLAGSCPVYR
ncbi:MAG TPA: LEA type 2 family protein [Rectinemataceae bacterium]|nr:LEA type 2 family protein [Rectinemataceae bacterium]